MQHAQNDYTLNPPLQESSGPRWGSVTADLLQSIKNNLKRRPQEIHPELDSTHLFRSQVVHDEVAWPAALSPHQLQLEVRVCQVDKWAKTMMWLCGLSSFIPMRTGHKLSREAWAAAYEKACTQSTDKIAAMWEVCTFNHSHTHGQAHEQTHTRTHTHKHTTWAHEWNTTCTHAHHAHNRHTRTPHMSATKQLQSTKSRHRACNKALHAVQQRACNKVPATKGLQCLQQSACNKVPATKGLQQSAACSAVERPRISGL